jgi:hypothetical protein
MVNSIKLKSNLRKHGKLKKLTVKIKNMLKKSNDKIKIANKSFFIIRKIKNKNILLFLKLNKIKNDQKYNFFNSINKNMVSYWYCLYLQFWLEKFQAKTGKKILLDRSLNIRYGLNYTKVLEIIYYSKIIKVLYWIKKVSFYLYAFYFLMCKNNKTKLLKLRLNQVKKLYTNTLQIKKKKRIFLKLKKLILEQKLYSATNIITFVKLKNIYNVLNLKYLLQVAPSSRM